MVCSMAAVYEGRRETEKYGMERFDKIDCKRERFAHAHPCLSFVFTLIGMPALMVGTVLGSATAILFPVGLLLGWL